MTGEASDRLAAGAKARLDVGEMRSYISLMDRLRRPNDMNQLAKHIVDVATGEIDEPEESPKERRARNAGWKGGPARARALTPNRRSEIARLAAQARWKKMG